MKRELITTSDGSHSYLVSELNETYHSKHGAISEAKHVFIKKVLTNIIQCDITGYRAASWSITKKSLWALDIIKNAGFKYSSSI